MLRGRLEKPSFSSTDGFCFIFSLFSKQLLSLCLDTFTSGHWDGQVALTHAELWATEQVSCNQVVLDKLENAQPLLHKDFFRYIIPVQIFTL